MPTLIFNQTGNMVGLSLVDGSFEAGEDGRYRAIGKVKCLVALLYRSGDDLPKIKPEWTNYFLWVPNSPKNPRPSTLPRTLLVPAEKNTTAWVTYDGPSRGRVVDEAGDLPRGISYQDVEDEFSLNQILNELLKPYFDNDQELMGFVENFIFITKLF